MKLHLPSAFFASDQHEQESRLTSSIYFTLLLLIPLYLRFRRTKHEVRELSQTQFWKSYPMSGMRKERFAWARVTLRSVFGSKGMVDNGYKLVRGKLYKTDL